MEQAAVFWHTFPSLCVGQMRIEVTRHGGLPPQMSATDHASHVQVIACLATPVPPPYCRMN